MKRGGFKRPTFERKPPPLIAPSNWREPVEVADEVVDVPKEDVIRSEAYRKLVAALPCFRCGAHGISQAAHPNTNKGGGIKTDDRLCFPLCCDQPGREGCHPKFDQRAIYTREERRALEITWGAETRRIITENGDWPEGLERIEE